MHNKNVGVHEDIMMSNQNYNQLIDNVIEYLKFEQNIKRQLKKMISSKEEWDQCSKLEQMMILVMMNNKRSLPPQYQRALNELFPSAKLTSNQISCALVRRYMTQKTIMEFIHQTSKKKIQEDWEYYLKFLDCYYAYKQFCKQHEEKLAVDGPVNSITAFYCYFGTAWGVIGVGALATTKTTLLIISFVLIAMVMAGQLLITLFEVLEELYYKERITENMTTVLAFISFSVGAAFAAACIPQNLLLFTVPITIILVCSLVFSIRKVLNHFCSKNSLIPGDSRFVIPEPKIELQEAETKDISPPLDQLEKEEAPQIVNLAIVARCHQRFFNPVHQVVLENLRKKCNNAKHKELTKTQIQTHEASPEEIAHQLLNTSPGGVHEVGIFALHRNICRDSVCESLLERSACD
jgi:hypothetical protein